MQRIAIGLTGVAVLGAALFCAPIVWSQPESGQRTAAGLQEGPPPWMGPRGGVFPGGFPAPGMEFPMPPSPLLAAFDSDGNGEIAAGEIESAAASLKKLDANRDGRLTAEEMMAVGMPGPWEGGRGFGPPGGPGPGGPRGGTRSVVPAFDKDGDGRLNAEERQAARAALGSGRGGPGGRGFGPPGGPGGRGNQPPPQPGARVSPSDVASYPDAPLYDPKVLRTLFLEFENDDWEAELAAFKGTDVEVPATLIVDGKKYPGVGVHFRGNSSYQMAPAGYKRSLNLSLDFTDPRQRLYGYKTLNLLNCAGDPSLMSSALYAHISGQYIPTPKANFVKLVIHGESWGVYANVQQFNKEFIAEHYQPATGARWKVPQFGGSLAYLGENIEDYRRSYEIKSKDEPKAWRDLIALCRTLAQTPNDQLEKALEPILDVEGTLWFLALDVALANSDGYWARGSDYSLFQDSRGKFHLFPCDINEAFHGAGGPGGFGPPRRPGPAAALGSDPEGGPRKSAPADAEHRDAKPQSAFPSERGRGARGFGNRPPFEPDFSPPGPGFGPGGPGPGPFGPGFGAGGPPFGPGGPGLGPFGPGFGPGGGGVQLDPLVGLEDYRKPLRSKLLAVPSLRARYLQCVRTIAETSLDWKNLGPVVAQFRALLEKEVAADTRKLMTTEAFLRATADGAEQNTGGRGMSLRSFVEQRRKYLLEHPEIASSPARAASAAAKPAQSATGKKTPDPATAGPG